MRLQIRALLVAALLLCLGCGGDISSGPDPDTISPAGILVGSWIATSMVLTNKANPQQFTDIVEEFNAVFTMDVQRSGRYSAILSAFGQSSSESGKLSVSGGILTMRREIPSENTSLAEVSQVGMDIIMDGESDFDFNQDGILEKADLHMVLSPR